MYQQIVYNEYLKAIIGDEVLKALYLNIKVDINNPFINSYSPNVLVGITNEFAAAAFRFGHNQIVENVQ